MEESRIRHIDILYTCSRMALDSKKNGCLSKLHRDTYVYIFPRRNGRIHSILCLPLYRELSCSVNKTKDPSLLSYCLFPRECHSTINKIIEGKTIHTSILCVFGTILFVLIYLSRSMKVQSS